MALPCFPNRVLVILELFITLGIQLEFLPKRIGICLAIYTDTAYLSLQH